MSAPTLLLLGIVGSTAYGLETEGSDKDYLGVYQEETRHLVGLNSLPESMVSHDPDKALHEIGKFMRLALAGNPTVNELLWLDQYETMTENGHRLVAIRQAFLSNKMRQTFGGYARQQAIRLARGDIDANQRKRKAKHGRHCFRLLLQGKHAIETGEIRVRLTPEERKVVFAMGVLANENPVAFHNEVEAAMEEFDAAPSVLPEHPDGARAEEVLLLIRNDGSLGG